MLATLLLPALLLVGGPAQAIEPCEPITSAHLLQRASTQFIMVGERHGTVQAPHFFGELVCRLSEETPILVGLEIEAYEQAVLDAFMASDGSQDAMADLLEARHWSIRDGRASEAMLDLLIRMRELKAAGRDIELVAFMLPAETPQGREQAMAQALISALERRPEARVAALIGKVHAEREPLGGTSQTASYLPQAATLTLSDVPWELCRRRSQCGAFMREPRYRVVADPPAEWRWPRYDFWYAVGEPFTASPQANEDAPEWGAARKPQ